MRAATRSLIKLLAAAAAVLLLFAASARPLLRAAGHLLVVDEPIAPADFIVVPEWVGEAGAIDAADLVHAGVSSRVAVIAPPAAPAEQELIRRGIRYADHAARLVDLLAAFDVSNAEVIRDAPGTEAEGDLLPAWCAARRLRSVIVISAPDHARRVRRVVHRSFAGRPVDVRVRAARYSAFDPDAWWTTRDGLRLGIVELQKLLLDVVRHPVP